MSEKKSVKKPTGPAESVLMKLLSPRLILALKLREEDKKTFREVGEALGCSSGRAQQIYHQAVRRRKYADEPMAGLSVRSWNCLKNMDYSDKEKIKEAIEKGELSYISKEKTAWGSKKTAKNFGKKSFIEVCEWAGATPPVSSSPVKVCPHCGGLL